MLRERLKNLSHSILKSLWYKVWARMIRTTPIATRCRSASILTGFSNSLRARHLSASRSIISQIARRSLFSKRWAPKG